jgi:uncharacterized protein
MMMTKKFIAIVVEDIALYVVFLFIACLPIVVFYDIKLMGRGLNYHNWKVLAFAILAQFFSSIALIKIRKLIQEFKRITFHPPALKSMSIIHGILFCALFPVFIVLILCSTGYAHFARNEGINYPSILYLVLLWPAAFIEELFFRYYMLHRLSYTQHPIHAIIISSVIFSFFHVLNPSFSLIPFFNLFLSGIIFSILYIRSNENLVWVTTVHAFWNFISGNVLGSRVSGGEFENLFGMLSFKTPSIINGGGFGIEGSVITTAIFFGFIGYLLLFKKKIYEARKTETYNEHE